MTIVRPTGKPSQAVYLLIQEHKGFTVMQPFALRLNLEMSPNPLLTGVTPSRITRFIANIAEVVPVLLDFVEHTHWVDGNPTQDLLALGKQMKMFNSERELHTGSKGIQVWFYDQCVVLKPMERHRNHECGLRWLPDNEDVIISRNERISETLGPALIEALARCQINVPQRRKDR